MSALRKMRVCRVDQLPETVCGAQRVERADRRRVVYLIEVAPTKLKIGVSSKPQKRVRYLLTASGSTAQRVAITRPLANAHEVESAFKRHFAPSKLSGEWFCVDFAKAKHFIEAQEWIGEHLSDEENAASAARATGRMLDLFDEVIRRHSDKTVDAGVAP